MKSFPYLRSKRSSVRLESIAVLLFLPENKQIWEAYQFIIITIRLCITCPSLTFLHQKFCNKLYKKPIASLFQCKCYSFGPKIIRNDIIHAQAMTIRKQG